MWAVPAKITGWLATEFRPQSLIVCKAGACPPPFRALLLLLPLLLLIGCISPHYQLRLVKIGLVAPLSGQTHAEGQRWAAVAREKVREWNTTVLAGRPYRVELVIYDEGEGEAVPRRLGTDPEVVGAIVSSERSRPAEMAVILASGDSLEQSVTEMLEAVTGALERPERNRREAVRANLQDSALH